MTTANRRTRRYDLKTYCRSCGQVDIIENFLTRSMPLPLPVEECLMCRQLNDRGPIIDQQRLDQISQRALEKYDTLKPEVLLHRRVLMSCESCGERYALAQEHLLNHELRICLDCHTAGQAVEKREQETE